MPHGESQNSTDDLQMVAGWSKLGFIVKTPQNPNNPIALVDDGTASGA